MTGPLRISDPAEGVRLLTLDRPTRCNARDAVLARATALPPASIAATKRNAGR